MAENTTVLTSKFTQALDFARELHDGDVRKGTAVPYLAHLLSVAAIVLEHGGTEVQAMAGLLHDAAEDHGGQATIDSIRLKFGDDVARIVRACSDSLAEDRTAKAPWWDRKMAYLDHLAGESADVALVSAADKLYNARSILVDYRRLGDQLWARFNADAGRTGTLWYYIQLVSILGERLTNSVGGTQLVAELRSTVDEIRALAIALGHEAEPEAPMIR